MPIDDKEEDFIVDVRDCMIVHSTEYDFHNYNDPTRKWIEERCGKPLMAWQLLDGITWITLYLPHENQST